MHFMSWNVLGVEMLRDFSGENSAAELGKKGGRVPQESRREWEAVELEERRGGPG